MPWLAASVMLKKLDRSYAYSYQRLGQRRRDASNVRKLSGIAISLLLAALLVGCGQTASTQSTPKATATSAPTATATLAPTPVATAGVVTTGHPCDAGYGSLTTFRQIGDLKVGQVNFLLGYPANKLPTALDASKPYQLPSNIPNPPNPPVNPIPNYGFSICNTSHTASHILIAVSVSIAAFTPFSGPLNTWQVCDGYYQRPDGAGGGGCGGGYNTNETLKASFAPSATTGARVTATQVGTGNAGSDPSGPNTPPLPVKLGPGQELLFDMGVTPPTAPGTYTFAFELSYDTVTSAPISTMTPTLFDSAAVKWSGQTCTKPALLSQIPATDTQHQYICAPPLG